MTNVEFVENRDFGFPKAERIEKIKEEKENSKKTYSIQYEGRNQDLPIILLKIGCPIYRIDNFRTASLQKEYLANNVTTVSQDFFQNDPESIEVQKAQDGLLKKLIEENDLLSSFESEKEKGQTEPLIITDEGIVVNGNRRLCAWRKLLKEDPKKFASFQMIMVAVLPDHDKDAVVDLETQLQIKRDIKAEYSWHAKAYSYISEMARTGKQYKDLDIKYNLKSGSVSSEIDAYRLAEKYLISINKKDIWSLVDKDEFAFKKIAATRDSRTTEKDVFSGDVFETLAFDVVSEGHDNKLEKGTGRLYENIPDIARYTDQIVKKIKRDIAPEVYEEEKKNAESKGINASESAIMLKVLKKVDPSIIAKEAVRTAKAWKSIDEEEKGKKALFSLIQKASSNLGTAVTADKSGQDKDGVSELLDTIDSSVKSLREWINDGPTNN